MRKKLLDELKDLTSFRVVADDGVCEEQYLFELPAKDGWRHENNRHVQRALGVVADGSYGPDANDRYWVAFHFWSLEPPTETLDATVLVRAIGDWVKDGTPIRFRVIGRYIEGVKDLGIEVRFRVGAPGERGPIVIDEEFDLTFSQALFLKVLDARLRRARGEDPRSAWTWVPQTRGDFVALVAPSWLRMQTPFGAASPTRTFRSANGDLCSRARRTAWATIAFSRTLLIHSLQRLCARHRCHPKPNRSALSSRWSSASSSRGPIWLRSRSPNSAFTTVRSEPLFTRLPSPRSRRPDPSVHDLGVHVSQRSASATAHSFVPLI